MSVPKQPGLVLKFVFGTSADLEEDKLQHQIKLVCSGTEMTPPAPKIYQIYIQIYPSYTKYTKIYKIPSGDGAAPHGPATRRRAALSNKGPEQ